MNEKITPDFFHRKTWQVVHNPASSDADLDIILGLAELFSERDRDLYN